MQAPKLLNALMQAQTAMSRIQKELEETVFAATAAGGAVKASVNGKGELLELAIDPELLSEGADAVAALVRSAVNAAHAQKEQTAKQRLTAAAGKLLPLGVSVPGLRS
jgi:hypothetical protein